MPVIIAGDLNADSLHRNGTQTYDSFVGAGFTDAWASLHPANLAGGLTWGHDEFLADPTTPFNRRIDFVFYRSGLFVPMQAEPSDLALDRDTPPFWASDHAALSAGFQLK